MPESDAKKRPGTSIRIDEDIVEILVKEQYRLRLEEGRKPTFSEVLRRLLKEEALERHSPKRKAKKA
jgi:hypothetical protein